MTVVMPLQVNQKCFFPQYGVDYTLGLAGSLRSSILLHLRWKEPVGMEICKWEFKSSLMVPWETKVLILRTFRLAFNQEKTGSTRLSIKFPIYPIFIPEKFKVKQFIRQWAFHVRVCSRVRKILKTDYLTQFPSSYLILQSFCGCGPEIPHFSSFETKIWKSVYFRQYQPYLK